MQCSEKESFIWYEIEHTKEEFCLPSSLLCKSELPVNVDALSKTVTESLQGLKNATNLLV